MRKFRKSWIGLILVFLFTISLFFWRSGSRLSKIFDSDNVLATVGNTPISTTKFNRTLQMNIQQFNQILGKELTSDDIKSFQIHQLALGALINDAVFENEFNKLNFQLDETIIANRTKKIIPQLYDEENNLDENYLKQFLSQQRLKVEDIVQIIHYDVRNEFFNSAFLNFNFPNSLSNRINTYNNHSRDIEYLNIPIKLIDISNILKENENNLDNVLSKFYETNISQYMSDEKRDIEYILIDKNDFINNFIPIENEILEYYNNNSDLFFEKEKRSFLQFNFKTLNIAEQFKKRIKNIITYEEVLSYANMKNIEYNVFDELGKDEIIEEIAQSLFKLKINEQSQIIKTPLAYHIVIMKNINPKSQLSFNEVRDDIIKTISNIDVNNFLLDLENEISQDIFNGFDLKEIVKKYELKLSYLENISKKFNQFDIKNELFFNNIIENAFIANLNFTNDIIKINKDKFYIYEVVKITDSHPINFNKIKIDVLEDWERFKRKEKIELKLINNNTNYNFLKELEQEFNKKIENYSITSSNTNIPRELVVDIFKSDPNTISYNFDENELHLSMLIKINIENKSDIINENIPLKNEIRNALFNELIKETKISTNDQLLDAIINSY